MGIRYLDEKSVDSNPQGRIRYLDAEQPQGTQIEPSPKFSNKEEADKALRQSKQDQRMAQLEADFPIFKAGSMIASPVINSALGGLPDIISRNVNNKPFVPEETTNRLAGDILGLASPVGVGGVLTKVGGRLIPKGAGIIRKIAGGAATGALGGALTPGEDARDIDSRVINTGAGLALGGAIPLVGGIFKSAAGAYKANKEISSLNKQISDIQKSFGLEGTDDAYIIGKLNDIKKDTIKNINKRSAEYLSSADKEIAGLKAQYDKLKDVMVRGKSVDFADFMKTAGPKWIKQGTERYGLSLERLGKYVDNESPISAEEAYNFVTKNIKDIEVTGIESPVLSYLRGLQGKYKRLYEQYMERLIKVPTDPSYKSGTTWDTVPFKELKAEMSGVYNHISPNLKAGRRADPADKAALKVSRSWSDLLKSKLSDPLKLEFEKLQAQYRPFAEAKDMMGKMFNPYTGELDVNKAAKAAEDFALNERDVNVQRLMKFLEEGEAGFIEGVPGLGERAKELSRLGSQAKAIKGTEPVIQRSKEVAALMYKKQVQDTVTDIEKWQRAYSRLSSERTFNQEKVNNFLKVLGISGVTAGTLGGAVSGYKAIQGLK